MASDDSSAGSQATPGTTSASRRPLETDGAHAFLHRVLDATFAVEPVTDPLGTPSFRFLDANAPALNLLGLSAEALLGRRIDEVLPAGAITELIAHLCAASTTGQARKFEGVFRAGNAQRILRWQVIPLEHELLLQADDVTETQRAQAELRNSQQYLSSVIANAPIIIYELDRDGVFKLSAGRSLAQIGLAPGQAVGGSIFDYFAADSPEVHAFRKALNGQTVNTETQLGEGYFESRYTPRYDDEGAIVGVLGVSYDVTERRQAQDWLQRAQKMEAVGQLTGGIAHDFNNLLAVILGNLDLLARQTLNDRAQALVEQAIKASKRGADLTKRLLTFSRHQVLEPRATDVNGLLQGVIKLLDRTIPENIEIHFEPAADLWAAHVDPGQLENAVVNLCVNARDAMPAGGQLTVSTRSLTVPADQAPPRGLAAGDYVEISIRDTGSGIAPELLERIFEPFFTTKEVGRGSGLGLSMVYGFVNQSKGGIEVESEPGQGCCMRLLLPRAMAEQPAKDGSGKDAGGLAQGRGELILVVEDDRAVRRFVNEALVSLNYRVLEAENGSRALELLERNQQIDLLLSDVVLPGGRNGVETYRQAQRVRPDLKAIFTSGYVGSAEIEPEAFAELNFIGKPYRIAELAARIREVLDRS